MPLVNNYGNLNRQRKGVLVPAKGSKWVRLTGSNPWTDEGYVELAESYLQPGYFAGEYALRKKTLSSLKLMLELLISLIYLPLMLQFLQSHHHSPSKMRSCCWIGFKT